MEDTNDAYYAHAKRVCKDLLKAFVTLLSHIDYLHLSIEYITVLYDYHNISCICYSPLHIDK